MVLRFFAAAAGALLAGDAQGGSAAPDHQILTRLYPPAALLGHLLPLDQWHLFPPATDRAQWQTLLAADLNEERERFLVTRAEALLGAPWAPLPATLYMEYARNGNRQRFQDCYFARRENLSILVLAECLEHRGRFMDEIANGIWAITEETTWAVPAHVEREPNDVLPRRDIETVDLFSAETAMTLATTRYLLRTELDRVSPALAERIRDEILRRVVVPVETSDRFGHSGWLDGHNNWSAWCSSNILGAALLLIDDQPRLARFCERLMTVVDRFIDKYPADGGCNEGPMYWSEASGKLLIFLELLRSRTAGWVDVYDQPKIAAMGRFIVRAHLAGPWFLNFADSDAKPPLAAGMVYRFGERVHSAAMTKLALLSLHGWRADGPIQPLALTGISAPLLGPLMDLFWVPAAAHPATSALEQDTWLPDLQLLVARESPDEQSGLILGAKGGRNDPSPSHSHNDAGHFVIYLDGQPGIVDIGCEEYTAQTFSARRFELWFTRGNGHNAPLIDGFEEAAGPGREATQLQFSSAGEVTQLGMNLENAYPPAAGIRSLRRTWKFARGNSPEITIRDGFALQRATGNFVVSFFSASPAAVIRPGCVAIACSPRRLLLEFEPITIGVETGPVPLTDTRLRRNWGENLYRTTLTFVSERAEGSYRMRFRAETK